MGMSFHAVFRELQIRKEGILYLIVITNICFTFRCTHSFCSNLNITFSFSFLSVRVVRIKKYAWISLKNILLTYPSQY